MAVYYLRTPEGRVYRPNPGQVSFHSTLQEFDRVCAIGGVRSGKSVAGCIEAFLHAMEYPGSIGVVARWTGRELTSSTWDLFKKVVPGGVPGPLVARCVENPNKTFVDLRAPGGKTSRVWGWNASRVTAIASMTLNWAFVDEANLIPDDEFEKFWGYLVSRLSSPDGPNRAWLVGNPTGLGALYKRFVRRGYHNHRLIVMPTSCNSMNLPAGYEAEQRRTNSRDWARRMLDGQFVQQEGQILHKWDSAIHVVPSFAPPAHWPRFVSIDPGQGDAFCALQFRTDENGWIWFTDEEYERDLTIEEHCKRVLAMVGGAKVDRVFVDPSARGREASSGITRLQLYREFLPGLNVLPADNNIDASIEVLQKLLTVNPDALHPVTGKPGSPRVFVTTNCTNVREQVPLWVWDPKTGRPRKGKDHAIDAMRYGVMGRPHAAQPVEAIQIRPSAKRFRESRNRDEETQGLPLIGAGERGVLAYSGGY